MPRMLRALCALLAAFTIGGAVVAVVPAAAGAASAHVTHTSPHKKHKKKHKKKPAKPPKPVTLAPGAVVRYYNVKISSKRTVRTALLRLNLRNPHIRLGAAIPGNALGAGRRTITSLTRANRAIGGINGDFFKNGHPLGGLVVDGVLKKSPRRGWDANFYIRGGRARIGPVDFTGTVVRAARPPVTPPPVDPPPTDPPPTDTTPTDTTPTDPAPTPPPNPNPWPTTTRPVVSVNALRDLGSNRLVLVNAGLAVPQFGRRCTAALATPTRAGSPTVTVTAVLVGVRSIPRRTGADIALVACGKGSRELWLRRSIAVGDPLSVTTSLAGGTPSTLVSGGRLLVKNGHAFNDSDGKTITGRNPETFACVSRSGTDIVLGTIDGRREGSSGVTLPELTRYLKRLKCWSGMVFDGGGSTTLVGQPAGRTGVRVLNKPSDGGHARAVTSGLLVYRR